MPEDIWLQAKGVWILYRNSCPDWDVDSKDFLTRLSMPCMANFRRQEKEEINKFLLYGDRKVSIRQAVLTDLSTVKNIAAGTISEIYPHYYPKGAVDFFLEHHSKEKISDDIKRNRVYLCLDTLQNAVGTVTVKGNEICRLFVLPAYQGRGSAGKCLILPKESSLNGMQTLSWTLRCRRNKSI